MRQITVTGTVNSDGTLTAQLPTDLPAGTQQVLVVIADAVATDWPAGYFETTFGSIPDLERAEQGTFEQRENLP